MKHFDFEYLRSIYCVDWFIILSKYLNNRYFCVRLRKRTRLETILN